MTRSVWIEKEDIVIRCDGFRLPYEFVMKKRGRNAIGRCGARVARRWLESLGIQVDRHHEFDSGGSRPIRPDFFDHSAQIAYEVKTGQHALSKRKQSQILGYEHALHTDQAKLVVYLNVAFDGKIGLSWPFRAELQRRGFRLFFLR